MIRSDSIESISASASGLVIMPGKMKPSNNFSKPSDIKKPSEEIGSWYLVMVPEISPEPFQARIHSVRGGKIRIDWPDKYSGIFCYPYTMDYDVDRIMIDKDKDLLAPIKSYLSKSGVKYSTSEESVRVGKYCLSVDGNDRSITVSRVPDMAVFATFPYDSKGIEQSVKLARRSRASKEFESLSDPVDISEDIYGMDVKRDPLCEEIENA